MRAKIKQASGHDLDWLIATIEKRPMDLLAWKDGKPVIQRTVLGLTDTYRCDFSTNWALGGEIIGREFIELELDGSAPDIWKAVCARVENSVQSVFIANGHTALVAAMRAYGLSRLGEDVDIPEQITCEIVD